jgi:hypothetical protein
MIVVPVSIGELIDKITILEIKLERIEDEAKCGNVRRELEALRAVRDRELDGRAGLAPLAAALKAVNEKLWVIEDEIRACERGQSFGREFVELARAVYRANDERARIKRSINEAMGSTLVEEKSYAPY